VCVCVRREKGSVYKRGERIKSSRRVSQVGMLMCSYKSFSHRKMLQGLELDLLTSSLVSTDHLFQRKPCLCLKLPV